MANLILTSSQAYRFWNLIKGRSPHVEDDVVEVAGKSAGDLYLRLAAQQWRDGVPAWPLAVDGCVEAVLLAPSQEEAAACARITLTDLSKVKPSLAKRTLRWIEGGFEA